MINKASTLLPRLQRFIDAAVAALLAFAGVTVLAVYASPGPESSAAATVWAATLTSACVAALVGVLLRSDRPGRATSVAYGLELGGWCFSAGCIVIFAIVSVAARGDAAGNAALFALGVSLFGKFLRRWAAVFVARREDQA